MGVNLEVYVAPASRKRLGREAFEALLVDLIRERIVTKPCALVEGADAQSPGAAANFASGMNEFLAAVGINVPPKQGPRMRTLYRGERSAGLLEALRAAAFETSDLCVCFSSLDLGNERLKPLFDHTLPEAFVYSLHTPTKLHFGSMYGDEVGPAELTLSQYFVVKHKWSPGSIKRTPIADVLRRHFGHRLVEGIIVW